ncbi:MAG: UDP-N-acetylmuramoyl-L-alanyl-D-glutamate--2,6-diaminopimelate ligase [Bacteroidales bacterium]|nr:UDP-N-acetylmuramoyl-L-alanyl-D-glutamate--2,6-diaminopimelate ligase [Bacteroidales bacterium]
MKNTANIFNCLNIKETSGIMPASINSIEFDSRKIEKGACFVAVKGYVADGHKFIDTAIQNGAIAVVCETMPENTSEKVFYVRVENSAEALGILASEFYGNPSSKLKLVGVTGTNGKTTTATLLFNLVKDMGFKTGLLSTVANYINNEEIPATHTTPDPVQLNFLLKKMVDHGCDYCFMEVSSHAIHQKRIAGLKFKGGIFTNITHDHLDYHKTFDEYIKAKKEFFDNLPTDAFALSNYDDKNGRVMLQNSKAANYSYGLKTMADFKCKLLESHFEGMKLLLDGNEFWSTLTGKFNAYNILSVYGTAILLDFNKQEILTTLSRQKHVNGRFETMKSPTGFAAIVDYAHTPDALKNVLDTINELAGNGKIITVVGAGGDRDSSKRPEMARVAAKLSSLVILTSDNPRSEDPEKILDDMSAGIDNKNKMLRITDRQQAIKTACMMAAKGDIILVAGKGHETYQEIKGVKHHFDDKELINELFKSM